MQGARCRVLGAGRIRAPQFGGLGGYEGSELK